MSKDNQNNQNNNNDDAAKAAQRVIDEHRADYELMGAVIREALAKTYGLDDGK